jgi:PAS domain S-box-containing protein
MRETARQAGFAGKEVRRRRKDGSLIDVNVSQAALYDTRGELTGYVLLIADITERTRAEAELRESEKRFRALIENSTDAISLIDANGNILYESPSYEWVMGHREEDRARQNMFELVHPDEREHLQRLLAGILEKPGQVVVPSTRVRRADGSWRWIEGIANNLLAEPSVRAIVINFRDITERKQAEEALRQYTSELQARNEELDAFAHMAAHDLKNPLANIIAYADEMRLDYDLLSEQERIMCVKAITTSGKKMNSILEELILLAGLRRVEVQLQPLDVASVVAEACQRLSFVIGKSQAEIVLPSAWPQAIGYAPWVEEIWANYISNAIQYGGKPPRVELGGEYLQDGTARFWTRDNGDGLTPEQQARLFTPFTQLNQVRAKGHGLGLSIVRRIVDKLHGQVGVESSGIPGQGCLFYFILPAPQS